MPLPKEFARFELVTAKKPLRRRIVMTSEGGPGCGKTDFFLRTFPRPALSIELDMNDEGIRERYEGEDIYFKDVVVPPLKGSNHTEEDRVQDMKIATMVKELYMEAVTGRYFRSIMIDEGAALYTLARRAFLQGLGFGESKETDYTGVNSWMARFFTLAKQNRINLYIPHRQTEERKDAFTQQGKKTSVRTGGLKAEGWKKALYESQCHVIFTKDEEFDLMKCADCDQKRDKCTCDKFKKPDPLSKFEMIVTKCTARTQVEGMMFIGRDITLPNLGMCVFPGSDEEDWK